MATRRPSPSRRLATAAAWPLGVALTSWHYMWRITPLHRRELAGRMEDDAPPPLPERVSLEAAQLSDAGVGPLFHRRYRARIGEPRLSAEELMDCVLANPNKLAPTEFARFTKVHGETGRMRPGDEYVVRMPGPWDGPVRVVDTTPTSFRLITLDRHLEAGQIEFRAADDGDDLVFTIESWARSGDQLSRVMYQRLRMAKEVQLHMWTSFLERAVKLAGGRFRGGIDVETRIVDDEDAAAEHGRSLGRPEVRRVLDELHDKGLNFDLAERDRFRLDEGWLSDDYCQPLPPEPPGPPVPGGSWEVAQRLMRDYEFADPSIVRAVYHPDRPLEERDILLEVRFYGLRFRFGVRVGGVVDEIREIDGRRVRVWGWNYRTLQGHLEMGQMDYEVWKWLDSGDVEFHTCRFSRRAPAGNPVVRLGVRIFGRRQQVKFARRACERMARLTTAELERGTGDRPAAVPLVADEVSVRAAAGLGLSDG
ncbi:MAG: DUF1990 domain-containing protein [Actinomycetota bacterium]|nr:DUF1990 domain-containing protein [Actinomycetota bacterium]